MKNVRRPFAGGGWTNPARDARLFDGVKGHPQLTDDFLGFRVVYDTPDVMPALGGCVQDRPHHVRVSGREPIRVHLQFQTERFGFRLVKEGT